MPLSPFSALTKTSIVWLTACAATAALAADPYASNNGLYPLGAWAGPYRTLNFDYPHKAPQGDWHKLAPRKPITVASAPAYVALLKKFVEPSMRDMIEKPNAWSAAQKGWYDMPWQAEGDATGGREASWVFTTFVYKYDAAGQGAWDKLVPLGAQWGNDPELALSPSGKARGDKPMDLQENWINPAAPSFSKEMLGWGGRLSGPIDVAKRHNVVFTDGEVRAQQRSSACMSCHGTAQYPFVANLYPSPNRSFPPDGSPFLLYPPGSKEWARWYQNKPGTVAQNKSAGSTALDYDMLIMLALSAFDAAASGDRYLQQRVRAH